MTVYDLHCHSTASDGTLTPAALVTRAIQRGVDCLAITDHDDISGLPEAHQASVGTSLRIVNGVELSSLWERRTIHVVGLFFDAESPVLQEALAAVRVARRQRAEAIAHALARTGIRGALEGARRFVTNEALISRLHFARFLVEQGHVSSKQKAFNRYLGQGKPAHVPPPWPAIAESIAVLHAAGGLAVLAHPGRYPLTDTAMRRLLEEFRDNGGDAIEVFSPSHTPQQSERFIEYARFYGFKASLGSDFHDPEESYIDLGVLPPLPAGLTPVWSALLPT
ncbi:MAG: PHP domain-containing protein [Proteobacteria bacterium]|nr:PHP domain-containing protein [Pseudomonadota bacterium]MCL2307027.1 PHP domain-containing protein [Pseudomonadota bacterium]